MIVTLGKDGKLRDVHGRIVGWALDKLGRFELTMGSVDGDGEVQLALDVPTSDGAVDVTALASGGRAGASAHASRAPAPAPASNDALNRVWDCYCDTMQPRSRLLGEQERKIINAALKVASWEECCRAIKACERSDFHMGRDSRRGTKKYNKLSQILKGKPPSPRGPGRTIRENVDFFLDMENKEGSQSGVPSASNESIRRAKREVVDAYEFSGDDLIVEKGQKARALLDEAGITTVDMFGRPPEFIDKL